MYKLHIIFYIQPENQDRMETTLVVKILVFYLKIIHKYLMHDCIFKLLMSMLLNLTTRHVYENDDRKLQSSYMIISLE